MLIEGNWGLGEGVVGGEVTPDRWVIDRGTGAIEPTINNKFRCVVAKGSGTEWEAVPAELQDVPCATDDEVRELVKLAERLEKAYGEPQDIEWVFDRDFHAARQSAGGADPTGQDRQGHRHRISERVPHRPHAERGVSPHMSRHTA